MPHDLHAKPCPTGREHNIQTSTPSDLTILQAAVDDAVNDAADTVAGEAGTFASDSKYHIAVHTTLPRLPCCKQTADSVIAGGGYDACKITSLPLSHRPTVNERMGTRL